MDLTYGTYLQLEKILTAQELESPDEHDETLFIIIHQVYELWFKQLLHESAGLARKLGASDSVGSSHTLGRMLKILKTMVSQVDVLETMTPLSFSQFRSYLKSSSGFQSVQFRMLEVVMGKRPSDLLNQLPLTPEEKKNLQEKLAEPSLFDHLLLHLNEAGFEVPSEILNRDFSLQYEGSRDVQTTLLKAYKQNGQFSLICESFVDLDEGIQEWRYRHVKMVERTIGHQIGTGGSSGVEYLKSTLFKPLFPDLWSVRSEF